MTAPRSSFAALLDDMLAGAPPPAPPPGSASASALRTALAVRGRADPRDLLPPGLDGATRDAALAAVAADAEEVPGAPGRWWLRDGVRRRVLATRPAAALDAALAERAPAEADRDPVLAALRARRAPLGDVSAWPADRLRALLASEAWLPSSARDALVRAGWHAEPNFPDLRERIAALLIRRQRDADLARFGALRLHGRDGAFDALLAVLRRPAEPGILGRWIYLSGVGGSGKSTLLAHLERAAAEEPGPPVVVHFDCDDPGFDPADLVALDLALLRQVAIALPEAAPSLGAVARNLLSLPEGGRVREPAAPESAELASADAADVPSEAATEEAADEQAQARASILLGVLGAVLGTRRLLLIIDTAELIFARRQAAIAGVADWLVSLRRFMGAPDLRVVIAGRDPVEAPGPHALTSMLLGRGAVEESGRLIAEPPVALGDLAPADAEALLRDAGLPPRDARSIAAALPRSPLLLRFAADLHAAGGAARKHLLAQARNRAIPPEVATRYVTERVLRHIGPPLARRYATTAMALPEVTPDLVASVVIPARDGAMPGRADAPAVFHALHDAGWLVRESGDGRRLWFHAEVRRLALALLQATPEGAAELRAVRELARAHYARSDEPASRTLHAYFVVLLDGPGAMAGARGLDPTPLGAALEDLPEAARTQLFGDAGVARPRRGGSDAASESDVEWRARLEGADDASGEGERLVKRARAAEALALYRERPTRAPGLPPTFVLQALADDAQWDTDEVHIGAMVNELAEAVRTGARVPPLLRSRIYWLTRYALLSQPGPLSPAHRALLRDAASRIAPRGPVLLLPDILAVAEAFAPDAAGLAPEEWFEARGAIEAETRQFLVRHLHRGLAWQGQPHADELWIMQPDWFERARQIIARAPARRTLEPGWERLGAFLELAGAERVKALPDAQELSRFLRLLRFAVPVQLWRGMPASDAILLLRGMTSEVHRPLRAAIARCAAAGGAPRNALEGVATRAVRRLGLPMREFSPSELETRLRTNLSGLYAILVPWSDRARQLPRLCLDLMQSLPPSPEGMQLRRVAEAFLAWDQAICAGRSSAYD